MAKHTDAGMRTWMRWALLTVAFALMVAGCAADPDSAEEPGDESPTGTDADTDTDTGESGDPGELDPVRLAFAFAPDFSMPGYFVSQELGFYEEQGVEVELQIVDGTSSVIQQLASGQSDIGVGGPPSALMIAQTEGADVLSFYQIDQENIFAVVVPESSDIESMEDLRGETIGISDFSGGEVPIVRAALATADLVEGEDVELLPVGDSPPTVAQALESGEIVAYAGGDQTTLGIRAIGVEFRNILPDSFASIPGNIAIVSRSYFEENTDVVTRFARAFTMGTYYSSVKFDEALEMGCEFAPENCVDEDFTQLGFEYYTGIQQPAGDLYGEIAMEGWQAAADILVEAEELPEDFDIGTVIDTSVIEDANDFDRAEVESR